MPNDLRAYHSGGFRIVKVPEMVPHGNPDAPNRWRIVVNRLRIVPAKLLPLTKSTSHVDHQLCPQNSGMNPIEVSAG